MAEVSEAHVTFKIGDKVVIVRDMNFRTIKLKGRLGEVVGVPSYNGDNGVVRACENYLVRLEPVPGDPFWFNNEIYLDVFWLKAVTICVCGNHNCPCGFTEKPAQ
jgi:hypothetical protein